MGRKISSSELESLPVEAAEFITQVIKKMRYRKKVRLEVMAELAAHFEDELRDCQTNEEKETKTRQLIEEFGDVKLLGALLRRAKKRCRSMLRTVIARTFQAAGLIILFFIIYVIWFLSGKPNITVNYVAELNKLVRPAVDESLNAAPLYHKAVELCKKIPEKDTELLCKKYFEANAEEKQRIVKILAENKEMLELATAGTEKPYYWEQYHSKNNNMISILLPNLSELRQIAYTLRWRAMLSAEQGRYEDAFNDLKTCYRLGQHVGNRGKSIREQLLGIGIETLSVGGIRDILNSHQINSSLLAKLQNDMEQLITKQDFKMDFFVEKLCMCDEIQRSFTGIGCFTKGHVIPKRVLRLIDIMKIISVAPSGDKYKHNEEKKKANWLSRFISDIHHEIFESGGFIHEPAKWAVRFFSHPDKDKTKKIADSFYVFVENAAGKTPAKIRAEGINIEEESSKIIKGNLLLENLVPAVSKISGISYRNKTESYATIAVIALVRYKADTGGYPADLQELVTSGYLKDLPMDAFSDKPLVYKKTDSDFLLYSVGYNFVDDGGVMAKDSDGKPKMWAEDGDMVFWPVGK